MCDTLNKFTLIGILVLSTSFWWHFFAKSDWMAIPPSSAECIIACEAKREKRNFWKSSFLENGNEGTHLVGIRLSWGRLGSLATGQSYASNRTRSKSSAENFTKKRGEIAGDSLLPPSIKLVPINNRVGRFSKGCGQEWRLDAMLHGGAKSCQGFVFASVALFVSGLLFAYCSFICISK